jgi:LDH2 family malate/lactate/ureidoglycolate dehydrogenase
VAGHAKVLIPGDPEREMEAERRQAGIPLLTVVAEELSRLGQKFGSELIK